MPDSIHQMGKRMPTILAVEPLKEHRLLLRFSSGSVLELNMRHRLHTVRYSPLKDLDIFEAVHTDGETLFFGKALQIGLEEVMSLAMTPYLSERRGKKIDC